MKNITNNKIIEKNKILSVFDFDGTLTYHDSFILFLYFIFGKFYFTIRMVPLTFQFICKQKLTRDEFKKLIIKTFLTDINERWIHQQAKIFCEKNWTKLMRPAGIFAVAKELNLGAEVTICSASPALVLQPFAKKLGVKLIGTQLEVKNGRLTGNIIGYNCRCAQKVERLEKIYGNLKNYHLRAWGDTRGDYELLAVACDPHWRYFHKSL